MLEVVEQNMKELDEITAKIEQMESTEEIIEYKQALRLQEEKAKNVTLAIDSMRDALQETEWLPGKRGNDEYWEGTTGIIRTKKTMRKIVSDRFVKNYPFLAGRLAHFMLRDVEPELPPEDLEKMIVREEVFSYKPTKRSKLMVEKAEIKVDAPKTKKRKLKAPA